MSRGDILFNMSVGAVVNESDGIFESYCPALDVASQGETEEIALKNLVEALQLFIESCYERGTLEAVLKDCGFRPGPRIGNARQVMPKRDRHKQEKTIDVPLSLLIQQARDGENRAC